jgi:hypothetical protein
METETAIDDQLLSIVTDPSYQRPPFGEATLESVGSLSFLHESKLRRQHAHRCARPGWRELHINRDGPN